MNSVESTQKILSFSCTICYFKKLYDLFSLSKNRNWRFLTFTIKISWLIIFVKDLYINQSFIIFFPFWYSWDDSPSFLMIKAWKGHFDFQTIYIWTFYSFSLPTTNRSSCGTSINSLSFGIIPCLSLFRAKSILDGLNSFFFALLLR